MYANSHFKLKCKDGDTKDIIRNKGIIQGDPWSLYVFLIRIDKWVRWQNHPHPEVSIINPVQGFVDDVEATVGDGPSATQIMDKTVAFTEYARMKVKLPKCAHIYGRRSGNNWYDMGQPDHTTLIVNGQTIGKYPHDKPYPYLGHFINLNFWVPMDRVEVT